VAQNFLPCDREQELLLPPSLREWLPEGHLAWLVIDALEALDLSAFSADYRAEGWGRAAHEPAMTVALLLSAYAVGERSSRAIERRCAEDIAFPGDLRQPHPRPRHHRALSRAPRGRPGGHLHPGAGPLRQGRAGVGRAGRPG
jgi:transposase